MQVEQHKWAEEGAELKGRLTAHEAQLDLMQHNMRETDQARTNLAQDLARLRIELEKVSSSGRHNILDLSRCHQRYISECLVACTKAFTDRVGVNGAAQ